MRPLGREEGLNELDRHGALTDRGAHSFNGAVPHVAGCKGARHARLVGHAALGLVIGSLLALID